MDTNTQKEDSHVKTEAEIRLRLPKLRDTKKGQQVSEAAGGKGGLLPRAFLESMVCPHLAFGLSAPEL